MDSITKQAFNNITSLARAFVEQQISICQNALEPVCNGAGDAQPPEQVQSTTTGTDAPETQPEDVTFA